MSKHPLYHSFTFLQNRPLFQKKKTNGVKNAFENTVKNATLKTGETSKRATSKRGQPGKWAYNFGRKSQKLSQKRCQKCGQKCDFKDGRDFEESNFKDRTDNRATSKRGRPTSNKGRTTVQLQREANPATSKTRERPKTCERKLSLQLLKENRIFPPIWSQVLKKTWSVIFVLKFDIKHKFITSYSNSRS